jgi:predicted GIY-YIG superfamily endonuclease
MSYVYLLFCDNGRRTYIGATNDVDRRLRQHNRELSGGARSTHGKSWTRACYIGGFPDWNAALQFEWMWKWKSRNYRGLLGKLTGLCELLQSGKSSSGSLPYCLWPQPPVLCIDLVEKIELFDAVKSVLGSIQFPHSKMSSVSNTDLSNLAVSVQLLRDEVLALKARMEELMAAPPAAHRPATKEPKLNKKKAADPTNTVVAVEDASASDAVAKTKRTRRTKEEIEAEKAAKMAKKAEKEAKKATAAAPAASGETAPAEPAKAKRGRKPKAAAPVAEAGESAPKESEAAPAESETAAPEP